MRIPQSKTVSIKNLNPQGSHVSNSTLNAVVTLTPPDIFYEWTGVLVQAVDENIRYTIDGTDPTSSSGFQLQVDQPPILLPIGEDSVLKFIEETASATLEYQFVTGA
jgi:hypothetical protein